MSNRTYDIGSIFSTDGLQLSGELCRQNTQYFALCRQIFYILARQLSSSNKVVMIPAYTCDTVYKPFYAENWEVVFYPITRDLRIKINMFEELVRLYNPAILILHPYYGCVLSDLEIELIKAIKEKTNPIIIYDMTQSLTDIRYSFVDYHIGCLRKWGSAPDGAFVEPTLSVEIDGEYSAYVRLQKEAMMLRWEYEQTGNESIKIRSRAINKDANRLSDSEFCVFAMSKFSHGVYANMDWEDMISIRKQNYAYLASHIDAIKGVTIANAQTYPPAAPLYFPIYCDKRENIQQFLAQHRIYCPILWPCDMLALKEDEDVKYVYNHLLAIPIDQRYTKDDMEELISTLNHYSF